MKRNRNKIRRFFTATVSIVAAFLFNISAYAQNIWHVDASVTQCGDGFNWNTAFKYLQDALDAADASPEDDQIWVAAGTYYVDQDCLNPDGTGDRVSTFQLVKDVWLLGGFVGNEDDADQRDPLTHITILSGAVGQGPNPLLCPGPAGCVDNPLCPPPPQDVLDGCCCCRVCQINPLCCDIEDGSWDELCDIIATKVCGGAYHVVTAGAEITDSFTTIIDGFKIRDGTAAGGGGPLQGQGGGMLITGEPSVIRCIFTNNLAGEGGAVSIVGDGIEPQLINCEFRDNPGPQADLIQHELTDGGALASDNATPTLTNCLFAKNEATRHGGAIYNVTPPFCPDDVVCGRLTLINSTLADNVANSDNMFTGEGGGVFNAIAANLVVDNCILWNNTDSSTGGTGETAQISGDATVNYSDIEGGFDCQGAPDCGEGNIDADPLFVSAALGDYRLLAGSPCIDTGNPDENVIPDDIFDLNSDGDPTEPTPELDLNDRVLDGNNVPGAIVDMGSYEFCPPGSCPWDLDGSCAVGILDLLALLAAWGPNPGHPADFDGDGTVGILDLLTLLANWGPCPAAGGVAGDSFEEELAKAGLSQADWEAFKECMSTGTQAEQDNCLCWMQNYLEGCDGGTRQACSDHDPFTDCVGDLNGDCCVDRLDAAILLNQLGPCPAGPGACLGDLNGDCVVDKSDHRDLLSHFGACPTTQVCPTAPPGCGPATTTGLQGAVTLMGFSDVPDYQANISATSESEAFVCACVLQVLLDAQP